MGFKKNKDLPRTNTPTPNFDNMAPYTPNHKPGILLNTKQAAERLNVEVQTLCNWRHQRRGPSYVKMGRFIMYEDCSLDRFISENRVILDA